MARPGLPALLLAALFAAAPARAQEAPVALVADRVAYDEATGLLVAEGDVEVLHQGRVLRAPRLVYDERADEIRAEGPITLVDPAGGVLLADAATLTPDLEAGLIAGARVLIAGELQLAAVEARRAQGRFVTLDRVIASTCTICEGDPTPTWAIRARRVTEDEDAQRIYFEGARVEVLGLPIAYLPRLSIPDPRVERASGFLPPIFQSSSEIYGFGVKLPYYRVLGPSADATITPFVTSKGGYLLEGEYRRRFAAGGFDVSGVWALDDGLPRSLREPPPRWAFFAEGDYRLPAGFVAELDASAVSDDVFLKQFDYSNADLLTSVGQVRRTREHDDFSLAIIAFQSLLSGDDRDEAPLILPDFGYLRRFEQDLAGGALLLDLQALGVTRAGEDDLFRATGGLGWRRDFILAHGVQLAAVAGAALDAYSVSGGADVPEGERLRLTPDLAVELRWPWVRRHGRADEVVEPIAQIVWSESYGDDEVPNEDSTLPEFSYSNLFSLNRYPGRDRIETGLRANLGLAYTRADPEGWDLGLTFGRVLRATDLDQFPAGTGLDGRWSDWVGAVSLDFDWGLGLENRLLVDEDFVFSRNEFSMTYEAEIGGLAASYIHLAADDSNPALGDQPETGEFALAARYRVRRNWEVRGGWRYDVANAANIRAGAGVTYGNECAEIDLSVSRRYTSSDNLPPATTIGFGVRLAGLGASQEWPARTCAVVGLR